jgi:hypothetical protein
MIAGIGQAIELTSIFKTHRDATLTGQLHDLLDAGILAAFGDDDAVESAAGLKCFADSMNAGESVHGKEVYS